MLIDPDFFEKEKIIKINVLNTDGLMDVFNTTHNVLKHGFIKFSTNNIYHDFTVHTGILKNKSDNMDNIVYVVHAEKDIGIIDTLRIVWKDLNNIRFEYIQYIYSDIESLNENDCLQEDLWWLHSKNMDWNEFRDNLKLNLVSIV